MVIVLAMFSTTSKSAGQNPVARIGANGNAFAFATTETEKLWLTAKHVADRTAKAAGNIEGVIIADGNKVLHGTFEAEGGGDDWSAWTTTGSDARIFYASMQKPAAMVAVRGEVKVVPVDRQFDRLIAFSPAPLSGDSGCALVDADGNVVGVVIGSTKEKTPVGLAVPIGVVVDGLKASGTIQTVDEVPFELR